jgi:uncharacterized protein (DUF2384 family)
MTTESSFHAIAQKARLRLGKDAERWLFAPNRNLAHLSPYEMSQSSTGARIVLEELERAASPE